MGLNGMGVNIVYDDAQLAAHRLIKYLLITPQETQRWNGVRAISLQAEFTAPAIMRCFRGGSKHPERKHPVFG